MNPKCGSKMRAEAASSLSASSFASEATNELLRLCLVIWRLLVICISLLTSGTWLLPSGSTLVTTADMIFDGSFLWFSSCYCFGGCLRSLCTVRIGPNISCCETVKVLLLIYAWCVCKLVPISTYLAAKNSFHILCTCPILIHTHYVFISQCTLYIYMYLLLHGHSHILIEKYILVLAYT